MASVNINIPAAHVNRVVHALCVSSGLEENAANAKASIVEHIKRTVANVEESEARQAAEANLVAPVVEDVVS